jgi:hypothetical protein
MAHGGLAAALDRVRATDDRAILYRDALGVLVCAPVWDTLPLLNLALCNASGAQRDFLTGQEAKKRHYDE